MASSRMRHFNSPEELALRQGAPPAVQRKPRDFMHFNHPEAVAARARSAAGGAPDVIIVEQNPAAAAEPPPSIIVPRTREPRHNRVASNPATRLEQLEELVYALLDDPHEAREFRMQLSNLQATTDSQLALGNRLRALEESFDQLPLDGLVDLESRVTDLESDDHDQVDDDRKGDTQPPPGGPAAPPATEPTT